MRLTLFIFILSIICSDLFAQNRIDSANYSIEYRDSNDTYLQVYIWDSTAHTEILQSMDFEFVINKKEKIKYTRNMDNLNRPLITKFEPGIYHSEYNNIDFKNVEIEADKLNILHFYLKHGRLHFAYINDRKTPVKQQALISRRFSTNETFTQNCDEVMKYPAGTYYVEINTLPPTKFSIDLEFNSIYELQIEKPATLILENIPGISNIQIHYRHGDQWKVLKQIVSVQTENKLLLIQPGPCLIRWEKNGKNFEFITRLSREETFHFSFNVAMK